MLDMVDIVDMGAVLHQVTDPSIRKCPLKEGKTLGWSLSSNERERKLVRGDSGYNTPLRFARRMQLLFWHLSVWWGLGLCKEPAPSFRHKGYLVMDEKWPLYLTGPRYAATLSHWSQVYSWPMVKAVIVCFHRRTRHKKRKPGKCCDVKYLDVI